jgi:hypothetical protein
MTIDSLEKICGGDRAAKAFVKSARRWVILARRKSDFLHPAITIAA